MSTPPEILVDQPAVPVTATALETQHKDSWLTSMQSLVSTVVIAVFAITFIVQAFQIPSESMETTLLIGDYLLVDKVHYSNGGMWGHILPYDPIKHDDI